MIIHCEFALVCIEWKFSIIVIKFCLESVFLVVLGGVDDIVGMDCMDGIGWVEDSDVLSDNIVGVIFWRIYKNCEF